MQRKKYSGVDFFYCKERCTVVNLSTLCQHEGSKRPRTNCAPPSAVSLFQLWLGAPKVFVIQPQTHWNVMYGFKITQMLRIINPAITEHVADVSAE